MKRFAVLLTAHLLGTKWFKLFTFDLCRGQTCKNALKCQLFVVPKWPCRPVYNFAINCWNNRRSGRYVGHNIHNTDDNYFRGANAGYKAVPGEVNSRRARVWRGWVRLAAWKPPLVYKGNASLLFDVVEYSTKGGSKGRASQTDRSCHVAERLPSSSNIHSGCVGRRCNKCGRLVRTIPFTIHIMLRACSMHQFRNESFKFTII